MDLKEGTWRDALGGTVIRSRMRKSPKRLDYELEFFPGVEVGLPGWERAHSQGKITGVESPDGIRYAPSEVNQVFQRLGIEKFIREIFDEKAQNVDIWLTTVTYTHPGTLRLKEIQYRVDAVVDKRQYTLFEASIEVEDSRTNPRITPNAKQRMERSEWVELITDRGIRTFKLWTEVINRWERVKNLTSLYKNEHKIQRDLAKTTFGGVVTNLFNVSTPELTIWDGVLDNLNRAKIAASKRDYKETAKYTMKANAHFDLAMKKYRLWKDKIESSGTKAYVGIGVVAVLAIAAACGAYFASANAAAAGTSAAGSVAATEQAAMQIRIATQQFEASIQAIEALSAAQEAAALAEFEAAIEVFVMTL